MKGPLLSFKTSPLSLQTTIYPKTLKIFHGRLSLAIVNEVHYENKNKGTLQWARGKEQKR